MRPLDTTAKRGGPAGRAIFAIPVAVLLLSSCAQPPPLLVPPAGSVDAAEGFGQAAVESEVAVIKGKFSFLFRRPGRGRVEALDPLARTMYYIIFAEERAFLVLPSKKVYVEDSPEVLMEHFLGLALLPDDILDLLSGRWGEAGPRGLRQDVWQVEKDPQGRVIRAMKPSLSCTVQEFFKKSGVPRRVAFSASGTSGRMKVLSIRFNPPPRPAAFETPFLAAYTRKSWSEIQESLKDDR